MSTGKIMLGILAGLAAGALLGIMFAPDKGSVTRKKISRKGEDFADGLKERFNEFINNVSEKFEEVKEEVSDLTEKAKTQADDMKKNVKTAKS